MTTKPLKYPGGKHYIAKYVIELMKQYPHVTYFEPFCGGCQVLFARDPNYKWNHENEGCCEIINDIWHELVNFYNVLRDEQLFIEFQRLVKLTPFHQQEFIYSSVLATDSSPQSKIDKAAAFFVANRMSRGGGFKNYATAVVNRTRRGINDNVSSYLSAIDGLCEIHLRLRSVFMMNTNAHQLIAKYIDCDNILMYLDPPYLHETRITKDLYEHEMTKKEHTDLLDLIGKAKCGIILSGYGSSMYHEGLPQSRGWRTKEINMKKASSSKLVKPTATEVLWYNFPTQRAK